MTTTFIKMKRQSEADPDTLRSQDMIIDRHTSEKGWQEIGTITLQDISRWDMMEHIEEIYEKVRELKPDYVVIREQDRIGFKDGEELGTFLYGLRKLNCKLWS